MKLKVLSQRSLLLLTVMVITVLLFRDALTAMRLDRTFYVAINLALAALTQWEYWTGWRKAKFQDD